MKIELKCKTGGFNFGDVIVVGKTTIAEDVAEGLVADGLAIVIAEKEVKTSKPAPKSKESK